MRQDTFNLTIIISVLIFIFIGGFGFAYGLFGEHKEGSTLGGRSGPVRTVVGTYGSPTATTTDPAVFGNDNDRSAVTTSTADAIKLLQSTDELTYTIEVPQASTTNEFYWKFFGSNDPDCDTVATSTTHSAYDPAVALTEDINWYDIDNSNDSSGLVDITGNATGTSHTLQNLNWGCLRLEYKGASTTALFQIKEKINTTD